MISGITFSNNQDQWSNRFSPIGPRQVNPPDIIVSTDSNPRTRDGYGCLKVGGCFLSNLGRTTMKKKPLTVQSKNAEVTMFANICGLAGIIGILLFQAWIFGACSIGLGFVIYCLGRSPE